MSHNLIEVNNSSPDILSDIEIPSSTSFAVFGRGESNNYSNSPATGLALNDSYYFYDTSPVNTITGLSFTTVNNWCTSITFPTGKFIVQWSLNLESVSSSWYVRCDLMNSSTIYGRCAVGSSASSEQSNGWGTAYLNVTSTTSYDFRIGGVSQVDSIANQGVKPSEYSAIYIWKVE